jgi:hypothetical protein
MGVGARARDGRRLGALIIIASVACVQLLTAFSRKDGEKPPPSQPLRQRETGLRRDFEKRDRTGMHSERTRKDSLIRIRAKAEGIEYLCQPADSE